LFAHANPRAAERLAKVKEHDRHYLAHDYFNRDWVPMYFGDMAEMLSAAKLTYACSSNYLDHVDAINLTAEQQALLQRITETTFKETVRDYLVNQQFRRDYWIKGPTKLSPLGRAKAMRDHCLMLVTHRLDVPLKATGVLGEADLNSPIYTPILDKLAGHTPITIGQLEVDLKGKGVSPANLLQAIMVLYGTGHIVSVQEPSQTKQARPLTDKLNAYLMDRSRGSNEVGYLASPVSGSGVPVDRFGQLFLLAFKSGKVKPNDWAKFAWDVLVSQNQKIVKHGKLLETDEDNLAELLSRAQIFEEKQLPILAALNIA